MGCCFNPCLVWFLIGATALSVAGVHLSKMEALTSSGALDMKRAHRVSRQVITDPQPFFPTLIKTVLSVPIPTNIGFFPGTTGPPIDNCDRDEIIMEDGTCQVLLSDGNCSNYTAMEVILDPETNKGFCAPRLCPPDRVFVPSTQLCHDPRDMNVCPPGRELYYSAYGTAVCTCPDGTIEAGNDLDDDVCQPILGKSLKCYADQVFWFKDFQSPAQCLPDPCHGYNLNRLPDTMPFVPNAAEKCFQLGKSEGVCPQGLYYGLSLEDLKGECTSLEDAGYTILDSEELQKVQNVFGPSIAGNNAPPILELENKLTMRQNVSGVFQVPYDNSKVTAGNIVSPSTQIVPSITNDHNTKEIHTSTTQGNYGHGTQNNMNNQGVINPNAQGNSNTQSSVINFPSLPSQIVTGQGVRPTPQNNNIITTQPGNVISRPFNQQNSQITTSQQNNITPVNTGYPSQGTTVQNSQSGPGNNGGPKEICTFVQSNGSGGNSGKKVCTFVDSNPSANSFENTGQVNTVFPSQGANVQNSQSGPENNGGPKEICTFVQSNGSGGNSGKKVCTLVDSNPSANSFEDRGRSFDSYGYRFGRSLGFKHFFQPGILTNHFTILPNGERINHFPSIERHKRQLVDTEREMKADSKHNYKVEKSLATKVLLRKKRNLLAYATPNNVYQPRLLGCKPGSRRDINSKCRNTIVPARIPKRNRGTRAAPPVPPTPSCPQGMAFNIRRMCVPATTAQNSITAFNLG